MGFNFPPSLHTPYLLSRTGTSCKLCLSFTFCRGDLCQTSCFFSSLWSLAEVRSCFLWKNGWDGNNGSHDCSFQFWKWVSVYFSIYLYVCMFVFVCPSLLGKSCCTALQGHPAEHSFGAFRVCRLVHRLPASYTQVLHGWYFLLGTGCCGTEQLFFQIVKIFPKCMCQTGDVCSMTLHCFESA